VRKAPLITKARPRTRPQRGNVTGAALVAAVAGVALGLGVLVPALGAAAVALIIGMAVRLVHVPSAAAQRAIRFASTTPLQAAIVLLGATLSLRDVTRETRSSVPLMLGTLIAGLGAAWVGGRALRVEPKLRTLVGVGTAICGASAIGAISGVIVADEAEIAYAISTIFVFNVVAVLLYPSLGHMLGLSQHAFGLWAGTAINDTSSVVAAAFTYGHRAGGVAIVTKIARTTMIVPIVVVLGAIEAHRSRGQRRRPLWRLMPAFLLWFLVACALNTAGLVSPQLSAWLTTTALVLITVALASIGLSTSFGQLRRTGTRPLILGALLGAIVGCTSLFIQGVL
jgi:uncharacterized integral membrane protein (TIGR00698 family)